MARSAIACLLLLVSCILLTLMQVLADGGGMQKLRRQKRDWIIPPRKLTENVDYTSWEYVAKIRSDEETRTSIQYSLRGHGADNTPVNLFTVHPETGVVRIHGILDREETAFYNLLGVARFKVNGSRAEKDINLRIVVVDQNDCAPVFTVLTSGAVNESSATATYVMKITAMDADEAGTLHTQIAYSIVEQNPAGSMMFYINQETGDIHIRQNTLNRETQDTYTLTIKGTDMKGAAGGMSGTGKVTIKILDVNDNIPTLEKHFYEGSVEENTASMEVMRIKALDADLIHTDNWLAVFSIVTGNEAGYFSITTDAKTNEGILLLNKAIDYEELKELNLAVVVSNKAEYHSSVVTTEIKSYHIKISVKNQPEPPHFQPPVKVVSISEDRTSIDITKAITTYTAIDSDTLQVATNVRYAKIQDIDNWLIIDERTAEIKLNKLPDRESKFLINGTYYAKIICITNDHPAKTATGTVAIQVEDFNDHCPTLTSTSQTSCYGENVVYVTAVDQDAFPNGAPFDFRVVTKSTTWREEHLNATTAILRAQEMLWPGLHTLVLQIRDQQGKACADDQVLQVEVCTCNEAKTCLPREQRGPDAKLGAAGVLLLLLGLLLLLLVPLLLLFCLCGGAAALADFKSMPFDTKEHLIAYHTEGQGEDKDVPLLQIPTEVDGAIKAINVGKVGGAALLAGAGAAGAAGATSSFLVGSGGYNSYYGYHQPSGRVDMVEYVSRGMFEGQEHFHSRYEGMGAYDGMALSEDFLADYYSQKASCAAQQHSQSDGLLIYDYEGRESPAGSVGCCSFIEADDDLGFLDDLDPKFKTLAEICRGSTFESESRKVTTTTARPAVSTMTTHKESAHSIDAATASSTVVKDSTHAASASVHVHENVTVPSQTLLVQQPALYYTAPPPVYVLEPQPSRTLLLSGSTFAQGGNLVLLDRGAGVAGHHGAGMLGVGQGLVRVDGLHGAQQGVVLVEQRGGAGGLAHHGAGLVGLSQGLVRVDGQQRGAQQGVVLLEQRGGAGGLAQHGAGLVGLSQGLVRLDGQQRGAQQDVVLVEQRGGAGGLAHHGAGLVGLDGQQRGAQQGVVLVEQRGGAGGLAHHGAGLVGLDGQQRGAQQGVVLVEQRGGAGGLAHHGAGLVGLSQGLVRVDGQQRGAQQGLLMVEKQGALSEGTGELSGSQGSSLLIVESGGRAPPMGAHHTTLPKVHGNLAQSLEVRGHGVEFRGHGGASSSSGSLHGYADAPLVSGSHGAGSVLVEERVSVTERSVQSSSIA